MCPVRITQSRHYGIMLAVVARQTDNRHWYARLIEKSIAHRKAIIGAAVVDEHDLVPACDRELLERKNQMGYAVRAVVDGDHDRQRKAALHSRKALNHERSPLW